MRLQAWLAATPKGKEESRGDEIRRRGGKASPDLRGPPIDACVEHLFENLFEAGPTSGEHHLSWEALRSWQECTGVTLSEFEAVTLVKLSREYLGMLHKAQDPMCKRPAPLTPEQQAAIAKRQLEAAKARHQKG